MKKNDFDLSIPQRESPWAIIFILWKTVYRILSRIWPALLVILFRLDTKKGSPDYILLIVTGIAFIAMIMALINYFKTYFFIQDKDLVITRGVLDKSKTNIPFERIQSVQFQENPLHTFFKVVQLKIETAGSEKAEADFYAIEKWKAEQLRTTIMASKKYEKNAEKNDTKESISGKMVLQLGFLDVLKVGLTRNHLKSGGVILIFIAWLYDNLNEIGLDTSSYYQYWLEGNAPMTVYLYLIVLFLIVSLGISLIRSILFFYHLKLERVRGGFKIVSGLLTRKEILARDQKIQMISWSDNLLKKLLGFFDIKIVQAGSVKVESSQKITIPGAKNQIVKEVIQKIFKFSIPDKDNAHPIDIAYFARYWIITSILFLPTVTTLIYFDKYFEAVFVAGFYLFLVGIRYAKFKKTYYFTNEELCMLWGGAFGEKNAIFPMYKIQGVSWHQSPYQRRRGLVTLTFYLASGSLNIPYMKESEAYRIINSGLYISESSHKKWM